MAFWADVSPAVVFVLLLRQTSHTLTCRPHHLHTCRSSSSSRVVRLLRCTFHRLPYSPAWIFIPSTFTFIQSHHSRPKHSNLITRRATDLTYPVCLSLSRKPPHTSVRLTLAICPTTHVHTFTHRHTYRPGPYTFSQQPHPVTT